MSVRFGGIAALSDVSLAVGPGEVVGVIGPNGAGKTTLFNAVCGFVPISSGSVSYGGRVFKRIRPHQLARLGVARTVQGVALWKGLSVLENVAQGAHSQLKAGLISALLGLPRSSREEKRLKDKASRLLGEFGIAQHASSCPGVLPYGVQKKVALARALMCDPSLLLLDEPASGLSMKEMEELHSLLGRLRERMGVLLVEHNMDFVMPTCDRLVVLNFGRVITSGDPDSVRSDPQVTTAYLGEEVHAP